MYSKHLASLGLNYYSQPSYKAKFTYGRSPPINARPLSPQCKRRGIYQMKYAKPVEQPQQDRGPGTSRQAQHERIMRRIKSSSQVHNKLKDQRSKQVYRPVKMSSKTRQQNLSRREVQPTDYKKRPPQFAKGSSEMLKVKQYQYNPARSKQSRQLIQNRKIDFQIDQKDRLVRRDQLKIRLENQLSDIYQNRKDQRVRYDNCADLTCDYKEVRCESPRSRERENRSQLRNIQNIGKLEYRTKQKTKHNKQFMNTMQLIEQKYQSKKDENTQKLNYYKKLEEMIYLSQRNQATSRVLRKI